MTFWPIFVVVLILSEAGGGKLLAPGTMLSAHDCVPFSFLRQKQIWAFMAP